MFFDSLYIVTSIVFDMVKVYCRMYWL